MALLINQFQPNFFTDIHGLHTAPTADWGKLVYALENDAAINARQLQVNLNEAGEYTGFAYSDIATFVYGGGIWVEWCGWPMAITDLTGAIGYFADNFQNLLEAMDVSAGYQAGPVSFSAVPSGWPYSRSLVSTGPVQGKGFTANPNAMNQSFGNDEYVYSSFAIRYGKGVYFYAFANSNAYGLTDPTGLVPFSQYWPFIQKIIYEVIGYGLTSSSGPGCNQYGTYKGETTNGDFVYERVQGSDTIRTIVDSQCTPISVSVLPASQSTGGSSANGTGTTIGGSGRGLCTSAGTYMGPGNDYGSSEEYDVYKVDTSTGYIYNVVDPSTCTVLHQFSHTTQQSTSPSGSGSSGSVSPVVTHTGGSTSSSSGNSSLTSGEKTALLIAGGVAVAGIGYYFLTQGGDRS